jgi:hypothetical protein
MEKVSTKFFQKPLNWAAMSSSLVAVGVPVEKPVPTGCSIQTTLVRRFHAHGFDTGLYVPYCHVKGPFSWSRPSRDEQPGYGCWSVLCKSM